jgi:hypothetical protein
MIRTEYQVSYTIRASIKCSLRTHHNDQIPITFSLSEEHSDKEKDDRFIY